MKTRNFLIIAALVLFCYNATAQQSAQAKKVTLILPNGKKLGPNKLDSLENAWGKGRVSFRHSKEDDEKGIMHLVRRTDEEINYEEAGKKAVASMLNKPAPLFELTDLQGKKWSLQQLRGKKVVLNFWFTSCPPCVQEMPELNKLMKEYKGKDVVFLGITFNSPQQVDTFLKKHQFDYTLLPDSDKVDKQYKIYSWPTSMVIDRKGIIRAIELSGENIRAKLKAAIDSIK